MKFEKIKKSIAKISLINFLNKFIEIEYIYPKKKILEEYSKTEKNDSNYYKRHPHQFRKDLISWAKLNDLVINK